MPITETLAITGLSNIILGDYYRVKHTIGCGSFGNVCLAVDVRTEDEVAIKLESVQTSQPQIMNEKSILIALQGHNGIPEFKCFGQTKSHKFIVMQYLGANLEDLFNYCSRRFSMGTVLKFADQAINLLEYMHVNNIIHRDVKPKNFVVGRDQKQDKVYLIDFGLSKRYRDVNSHFHIPYRENLKWIGTARFGSLNAHRGLELSRRDDMESLGYIFVYFLRGDLPWQGVHGATIQQKLDKITEVKLSISIESLCEGLPNEFARYLQYCQQLNFEDPPNYSYCRNLFETLRSSVRVKADQDFDWNLLYNKQNIKNETRQKEAKGLANKYTYD